MVLHIKNMVCRRCKMAIERELLRVGLQPINIHLGVAEIQEKNIDSVKNTLSENLKSLGFELIEDRNKQTVEQIKNLIIKLIHQDNGALDSTLSTYLSQQILQEYSSLSNLFSIEEGITIEQYYIRQKVEKVKELLSYDKLTLKEIAFQLQYSSVAHLSNQFKKTTGMTPTEFKKSKHLGRKELENI